MAIEIKELVIKMTVNEKKQQPVTQVPGDLSQSAKRKIVQECIEKVLEKLDSKLER